MGNETVQLIRHGLRKRSGVVYGAQKSHFKGISWNCFINRFNIPDKFLSEFFVILMMLRCTARSILVILRIFKLRNNSSYFWTTSFPPYKSKFILCVQKTRSTTKFFNYFIVLLMGLIQCHSWKSTFCFTETKKSFRNLLINIRMGSR